MAVNLIDLISKAMTPDMLQSVAKFAGESDGAVKNGIAALLPVLLGGMASKASASGGPANLFSMVTGPNVDTGLLSNLSSALSGNQGAGLMTLGSSLLSGLFGGKAGGISDALSSLTGLRSSSAVNLIGVAAPFVFSFLKKYVADHRLDVAGLAALLLGQKEHLVGAIDPKFASALGFTSPGAWLAGIGSGIAAAASSAGSAVSGAAGAAAGAAGGAAVAASSGLARWLPWLIGLALLAFLLTQFGQCSNTAKAPPTPAATAPVTAPAAPAAPVVGTLPAKVYFVTGKADIGPEGAAVIQAVAATLAKDTATKIDLTGYTDKTGDSAANDELAKNRALAVRDALVAAGISVDRIGAKPPMFVEIGAGGADNEARRVEITAQ